MAVEPVIDSGHRLHRGGCRLRRGLPARQAARKQSPAAAIARGIDSAGGGRAGHAWRDPRRLDRRRWAWCRLVWPHRQDDSVHLSHISTHILTRFYIHEQS